MFIAFCLTNYSKIFINFFLLIIECIVYLIKDLTNFLIFPFKNFFFDKTLSYDIILFSTFLILLPIVLVSGNALPDIFLSLIALYFLIKSIFYKYWHYYKNPIVIGFLLFSLYGVLRSLFSEMPINSLTNEGSLFYLRYIFFAMGVRYLLEKNPYLLKCFLIIAILSVFFACLDSIYQYFNEINFFGFEKHNINRLTGLLKDEPKIGRYVAFMSMLICAIIHSIYDNSKNALSLTSFLQVLSITVIFLAGERSALFHYLLFLFLFYIFLDRIKIYFLFVIIFSIVFCSGIILIKPNAKDRMIDYTLNQLSETKLPFYSLHHEEHYLASFKMFYDYPIFGIGTNTFRDNCNKSEYKVSNRSCATHPHNFYLQLLAELGLIGFCFIASFFLFLSFKLIRLFFSKTNKIINQISTYYLVILISIWWPLIPHLSIYNNWNNVLMMLPLGFFMRYLSLENIKNGNTK